MTAATAAYRATVKANGASARHKSVRELRRTAIRLTAYSMALDLQRTGSHFSRRMLGVLRGKNV